MSTPAFVPGLELASGFYRDLVGPLLGQAFPQLRYSAALIGHGSEVLGFDSEMSTDHHWGPRVMLFLGAEDLQAAEGEIRDFLSRKLPPLYRGWSTSFTAPDPADHGVQRLAPAVPGTVNHRVELRSIEGYFRGYLGIDVSEEWSEADWLSIPTQKLRSLVAGAVFHDELGLDALRARLSWYPRDVWLYILGCCWARIGQEEHLMGRAGSVGDEIGSALLGARLVRDVMRAAFLLERSYPPYPKWFGSAFAGLACAEELLPSLAAALRARSWQEREVALTAAYESLLELQRSKGIVSEITGESAAGVSRFWGRPFLVIRGDRVAQSVFSSIRSPTLRSLAERLTIGSVDLWSDNTDLLENPTLRPCVAELCRGGA